MLIQRVRDALRACPVVGCDTIVGYRGRILPGATPSREDMGPPPRIAAPANRYNQYDLDLISAETIIEMRDRPKVVDWKKRMKDAGAKAKKSRLKNAAAKKRKLRSAGLKAAAKRKQNAALVAGNG